MGLYLCVLIAVALAVPSVRCEGLFDEGLEYVYSFNGYTSTGVKDPAVFGSAFGIQGTLTVQRQGPYATAKLDNIQFALGNGHEDLLRKVKYLKKADATADLEKPFRVKYEQGKIVAFETDPSDTFWSVSLKKGIASPLQMDVSVGANELGKNENAYTRTTENTVAGNCKTTYSFGATDALGKGFNLIKQRTSEDCADYPKMIVSNFGETTCNKAPKDNVLGTTHIYYVLEKNSKSQFKASFINTFGYTIHHLFQPKGVPMYNFANSSYSLRKNPSQISNPIDVSGVSAAGDLKFAFRAMPPHPQDDVDLTESDLNIFHPEEPKPPKSLQSKVIDNIGKLEKAMSASAVDEKVLQDQTLFDTMQLVAGFDTKTFKSSWEKVKGDKEKRKLYLDFAAQSGANAGAMFLKDVIVKGDLDDQETRRVLAEFPYHIRAPTEKLLGEFDGWLRKSPFSSEKNERAFLFSFAHLAQKTCHTGKCREETVSRIGKLLYDKFNKAKTYEEQVTAMYAMKNFGHGATLERLIAQTKPNVDRSIRLHALSAIMPLANTNRDRLMSVVIPIYLNAMEPTEIRLAAVGVIMNSKPTFLDLQQIVAGVVWDRNPQVVNYVVSTFRSFAQAKNPCIAPFANKINLLLRRISHLKTKINYSSNRYYDYSNDDYGFGGGIQIATIYGDESRVPLLTVFRVGYRVGEYNYVPLEIMLRLEGIEDTFVKVFRKLDPKAFKLADLEAVLKQLNVVPRVQNPFKIELAIRYNQQTVFYRHLDSEKLKAAAGGPGMNYGAMAKEVITLIRNQAQGILLGSGQFSWRPNDLGVPIAVGVANPKHLITKDSFSRAEGRLPQYNIEMNSDLRLYSMHYMFAYNPLGMSQGAIKYRSSRVHLPMNAVIGVNPADQALTFALKTHAPERGISVHMSSGTIVMVYGKDSKKGLDYMTQSCKQCKVVDLVTAGPKYLRGEVIRDSENERLGLESHFEIYRCEQYSSKAAAGRFLYQTLNPNQINNGGSIFGFAAMAFMHMRNFLNYYPAPGACNLKLLIHQAKTNPTTELQFSVGRDMAVPKKFGVNYNYYKGALKLKGDVERQYNFKVQIERAFGNVKSKVSLFVERQPAPSVGITRRAVCFDVKTAWSQPPNDAFEFPSATEPSVAREVSFKWGETQKSGDCPDPRLPTTSTFKITGNATITDYQREAATKKDRYPFDQCIADKTADGRTGVVTPLTKACYDAVNEYATPSSIVWNAEYRQISNRGKKFLVRLETLFRTVFMAYWDMHVPATRPTHDTTGPNAQNSGNIELRAVFNDEEKNVEVHLHTDTVHNHFYDVGRLYKYKSLIRNTRLPAWESILYSWGFIGICDVAPKKTISFDLVNVEHNLPKCWTLASADCSPQPRYALFVKDSGDQLPLAAQFYVGGHVVELAPKGGNLGFSINGKDLDVKMGEKLQFPDADSPLIVVTRMPGRLYVRAVVQRTTVRYTGDDVNIMLPASYKSATCGLCGDFNGQPDREFKAPSGCTLASGQDVANAFVLKDGCKAKVPAANCMDKGSGGKGKGASSIVDFVDLYSSRQ
ncbi:uncharacterized protein LOC136043804 [Artemia franciscana]